MKTKHIQNTGKKYHNNTDTSTDFLNDINGICKGINNCKIGKNKNLLIAFHDIIIDENISHLSHNLFLKFQNTFNEIVRFI